MSQKRAGTEGGANRRQFLGGVLAAGGAAAAAASALGAVPGEAAAETAPSAKAPGGRGPLERVRVACIGVGDRGIQHVDHLLRLEGVDVVAVCDPHEPTAKRAAERCKSAGREEPALYMRGDEDFRRLHERDDLDAVFIATPWRWHVPQAVSAMESGKHAFVEVPAALTLEGCWQLVEAAEATGKQCMMLENVCYGREELMVLRMVRESLFGELTHGECAYIHDLRFQMKSIERGTGSWRTEHHTQRDGNLYPTHGLGPIAQYMNINRGDRFDHLVSMSSPALGRAAYAEANFPEGHGRRDMEYICGDMNTTLIRTAKGRTIMVQHDTTTPRPYDRINLIQGTQGVFRGYPARIAIEGRGSTHGWQDLAPYRQEFEHPLWTKMGEEAVRVGGHGGMDFLMLWRLITCLRSGEALDQDVYDAAAWSVITPLSEASVASRSSSINVPDFTRGRWQDRQPLAIVR